jgi:HK97 gp10 family phage protein
MKPSLTFRYDFSTLLEDISKEVDTALNETTSETIELIRQLVPIDTGDLRDSYMSEKVDETTRRIGSNPYRGVYRRGYPTTYGPYVEYGTSRQAAQPHFTPAMERVSDTLVRKLGDALRRRTK